MTLRTPHPLTIETKFSDNRHKQTMQMPKGVTPRSRCHENYFWWLNVVVVLFKKCHFVSLLYILIFLVCSFINLCTLFYLFPVIYYIWKRISFLKQLRFFAFNFYSRTIEFAISEASLHDVTNRYNSR